MFLRPKPPAVPSELVTRFGEPELVFGPNVRFRVVSVACALVFVVMGVVLFVLGIGPGLPLAGWAADKLAVPLVVLGAAILVGTRLVPCGWVYICPGGVIRARGAVWDSIGWAEVDRFEDATLSQGRVTFRQCRLVLRGGGEWGFLADHVAEYDRLAEVLRQRVTKRDSAQPT
jgi:hypothetical protein